MVESEQGVHLSHHFNDLKKLKNTLRDTLTVHCGIRKINKHLWWCSLRRLELPTLALLGHFGGTLAIL
jgi:uncharacterized radical SAM superfamily protein